MEAGRDDFRSGRTRGRTPECAGRPRRVARRLWPAYAAGAVLAAVVANTWFRPGAFIATGDTGPFIRNGWMGEVGTSWGHAITGAGSATGPKFSLRPLAVDCDRP